MRPTGAAAPTTAAPAYEPWRKNSSSAQTHRISRWNRDHGRSFVSGWSKPDRNLCDFTARTLKLALSLLGIKTVEQM